MALISDFLSPAAMRKIDALSVRSRYVVEGARAGMHASPLRGASVEFSDHRQYVKGDNLRNLDWKVYGRTERFFVKRYQEETSLRTHIILDGSASMGYRAGSEYSKYEYGCRVAAAIGYLVGRQQDAIGLTVYDDTIREHVPSRSGPRHLRLFVERMAAHKPSGRTDTGSSLHGLAEMISRRGLIVFISDLFDDPESVFRAMAHFRKKMHDIILFQVMDPVELDLSIEGIADFVDMETGEILEIDPGQARFAYKQELERFIESNRARCASMNIDYRTVSTGQPFDDFISQYLAERGRLSL